MKAIFLKKHGVVDDAFEFREVPMPEINTDEILIKVIGFGLNYADVLARKGLYGDAPPLPCVLGYEVVGIIEKVGSNAKELAVGDKVLAFTRFGGYAEYVKTTWQGAVKILPEANIGKTLALGTQYSTALYAAYEMLNLHEGDKVLIHAAAGGVGIALIQLAKAKGCYVIGTVGNNTKKEVVLNQGADLAINYHDTDFEKEILEKFGRKKIDVVFDSVGGKTFKKSMKLLSNTGKMVVFGASSRSKGGILETLKLVFGYGWFTPISLLMKSQSIIGVNMLRLGDYKPMVLRDCMKKVVELYHDEILHPLVGATFQANEIATAHALLENRKSVGKIVILW